MPKEKKTNPIDILIIGQGLAGSILADRLIKQGFNIKIIHHPYKGAASPVAAGLIYPITGKRFAPIPNFKSLSQNAESYYQSLEKRFNTSLLLYKPTYHFCKNQTELDSVEKQKEKQPTLFQHSISKKHLNETVAPHEGGIEFRQTVQLNIPELLSQFQKTFKKNKHLIQAKFEYKDLKKTESTWQWKSIIAKQVIFCEGYKVSQNPFFKDLPWTHAKGDIIEGTAPDVPRTHILNNGHFYIPVKGGNFKFGATYTWDFDTPDPKEEDLDKIEAALNDFIKVPTTITQHASGIRPIAKDRNPVLGWHPEEPTIGICNGFGSKGALLIPHHTETLAKHIQNPAHKLEESVSISRFLKNKKM